MLAPVTVSIDSLSPEDTSKVAERLSEHLAPGDVVCLSGNLGAGKSVFARGIIQKLTGETEIPSPTFTLVQTYQAPAYEVWHADLYRLSDVTEVSEIGLDSAFEADVCLIEWPERMTSPPSDALWVTISTGPEDGFRRVELKSTADKWRSVLPSLATLKNGTDVG